MKKAFSLIEVLISITIFSIIIIFLYQALDITKITNDFYSKNLNKIDDKNELKKIVFEDFARELDNNSTIISIDENKNTILQIKTTNTFHNPVFTNITYLLSKKNELLRVESLYIFDKNNLTEEFFKNSYIDIVYEDISLFKISKNEENTDSFTFAIKTKNENKFLYFTTLKN